ncbi:MAG: rod-binding protein [Treponemataceae bacterium]|nr:rod-binding protein [Treponemataceae bacterium]
MIGINGITGGYSGITNGESAAQTAAYNNEQSKFESLIQSMMGEDKGSGDISSSEVIQSGRLGGDYTSGFAGTFTSQADKNARPQGAAANSASTVTANKTIDKTSKLYESALELESYFVKIMLSSMKNTLSGSGITGEKSFATGMYEDMLYDEIAVSMTKNSGFGLADQIYLELA